MRIASLIKINIIFSIVTLTIMVPLIAWTLKEASAARTHSRLTTEIHFLIFERALARDEFFLSGQERHHVQWNDTSQKLNNLLYELDAHVHESGEEPALHRVKSDLAHTESLFKKLSVDEKLSAEQRKAVFLRMLDKSSSLNDNSRMLKDHASNELERAYDASLAVIVVFILAITFFIIGNSLLLYRKIHYKLTLLNAGVQKISGGDLDHRIEIQGEDELLQLAQSINSMTVNLRDGVIQQEKISRAARLEQQRIESLLEITQLGSIALERLLNFALDKAIALSGSSIGYIYYYDEKTELFTLHAWSSNVMPLCTIANPSTVYQLAKTGIWGEAVRQRRSIIVNDFCAAHPLKKGYPEGHAPLYRFMTIPVYNGARIVAVVGVGNKVEAYEESDVQQLSLMMDVVWRIAERSQAQEALRVSEERLLCMNRTLEKRVQEEFEKNRAQEHLLQLQSRHAAMGEMIGNIAHHWRQPLNNLGLYLQALHLKFSDGGMTADDLQDYVSSCMTLIKHMSQTIDDFRNFFKRDKTEGTFTLKEAVSNSCQFQSAFFMNNNIRVIMDMSEDVATFGHINEYTQVLVNILGNASQVLVERNVQNPLIRVSVFRQDSHAVVTIADNGGGIEAGLIGRVFDPYTTTKRQGMGTGIGLYISRTIIEQNMGGRIIARNTQEGAEFRIEVKHA